MAVHPDEYSVDVTTEFAGQIFPKIGYMSQYVHHANGEGTYCIPEVGAWCWVCIPSDHNRAFVLGFLPPFDLGSEHKANRLDLGPGDQAIVSRELNGIIIRRGGITQVGATPICQRIYTPIANQIRDICENYELSTAAGTLRWSVRRSTEDEQSRSPAELVIEAKEFAQDDPVVILRLGSVETPQTEPAKGPKIPAGTKIVLDVEVVGAFKYRVNLDGDSLKVQEGDRALQVKGSDIHFVDTDRELQIFGDETKTVKGSSTRKVNSEDVKVTGTSKEKAAKKVIVAPQVFLGDENGAVAALLGPALLGWLSSHTHTSAAPASPTTPPVQLAELKIPAPANRFLSKRVKLK